MTRFRIRLGQPDAKQPRVELVADLHDVTRSTGRLSNVVRIIDRGEGTYRKRISDALTGEEVYSVNESLSDHQGRGGPPRPTPRRIGLADFERYAKLGRVEWIATPLMRPRRINVFIGNRRTTWNVECKDTPTNRKRLADAWTASGVPPEYGTDPRTGDR